jgi:beta-lactamase class D
VKIIFVLVAILTVPVTFGDTIDSQPDPKIHDVAELFEAEGVSGTLLVAATDGSILHVYNPERAKIRYSPASTFKIPNTLIALDAGIVTSIESPFKWDGQDRGVPTWNQDQTLQSAFRVSCVWCYQEIARQVGLGRYTSALADIDYGNQQPGQHVDQFWLNGDLQISALEQIDFLKKLYDYSLPYSREQIDIVKTIMLDEEPADYVLRAKTGWTGARLHVGWYVGYVENGDDAWLFAMNISMDSAEQAGLRKDLTIRSLHALGIL